LFIKKPISPKGGKNMNKYELLFILDRDLSEEKREEIINRYKAMIEQKGEVISLDKWGMKKLAYTIKFKNEGYYVLITFNTQEHTLVEEITNLMNITDGIIRHMFVKI
jgi:small subunit ribosomal protein S6